MKKIIRSIALAALVASPFSQSISAESFSAAANGFTYGVQQAQLGKNNHIQTTQFGQQSTQATPPDEERPVSDMDVFALVQWTGCAIVTFAPLIL